MDSSLHRSVAGESLLSFEDLPDQAIGIIMRKLEHFQDKVRLTQASPSARRLTRGPNCEPDVMGDDVWMVMIEGLCDHRQAAEFRADSGDTLVITFNPFHPDFPLALDYLAARSKAFSKITVECLNESLETSVGLLDALYRQGACSPVNLKIHLSHSSSTTPESQTPGARLSAEALVSHWLTVSEGIHSPRDRSIHAFGWEKKQHVGFFNGLRGIGALRLQRSAPAYNFPLPELPHLADCLEKLDVSSPAACLDEGPENLKALREVSLNITAEDAASIFTVPLGSLHPFFASCANSLESVRLISKPDDEDDPLPVSFEPFALMPNLRTLELQLGTSRYGPDCDLVAASSEKDVFLPSLERLKLSTYILGSNDMIDLLTHLTAPKLRVLEYEDCEASVWLNSLQCSHLPSLEELRVSCLLNDMHDENSKVVVLGDLSGFTLLKTLEVGLRLQSDYVSGCPSNFPFRLPAVDLEALPPQLEGGASYSDVSCKRWTAL